MKTTLSIIERIEKIEDNADDLITGLSASKIEEEMILPLFLLSETKAKVIQLELRDLYRERAIKETWVAYLSSEKTEGGADVLFLRPLEKEEKNKLSYHPLLLKLTSKKIPAIPKSKRLYNPNHLVILNGDMEPRRSEVHKDIYRNAEEYLDWMQEEVPRYCRHITLSMYSLLQMVAYIEKGGWKKLTIKFLEHIQDLEVKDFTAEQRGSCDKVSDKQIPKGATIFYENKKPKRWHLPATALLIHKNRKIVSGVDPTSGNYFMCLLPANCRAAKVETALEALKPSRIQKAQKDGEVVLRQGEWWFIPYKPKEISVPTKKEEGDFNLPQSRPGGNIHEAEYGVQH